MLTKLGQCNAFAVPVIIVMGAYIVIKYVILDMSCLCQLMQPSSAK